MATAAAKKAAARTRGAASSLATSTAEVEKALASGEVAAYEVVSPLSHDGEDYAVGDDVVLTPEQAAPLVPHTVREREPT